MTIRQNNQGKQIGVDILRPGDLLGILTLTQNLLKIIF